MIKRTIQKLARFNNVFTLRDFIHDSRSVGFVLIFCTALSLIITNAFSFGNQYYDFWHLEINKLHSFHLPHSILHIINDALMAVFFFMVGMEIKRETLIGELSSKSSILFPSIAALSGVLAPAFIFLLFTKGTSYEMGWAIPTATDIAFSLGILAMAGKNIPYSFKVFLTALAIIDDLAAIIIIAFFYGSQPQFGWLLGVLACIAIIYFTVKYFRGTRFSQITALSLGVVMWYFMYRSGIHATFAGVLLAMLLPIERIPLYEKALHIPVNFIIIPIFALANTSILISVGSFNNLLTPLSLGIILGLLVGKPLGIGISSYLMIKSKAMEVPKGADTNMKQFIGLGVIAGIGFTMSIFVSTLAFDDPALQDTAKLAVLIASTLAMIIGFFWLNATSKKPLKEESPMFE